MGIRGMTWSFEFGRSRDQPRRSDDHHGSSQWYQSGAVPRGRSFAGDSPEHHSTVNTVPGCRILDGGSDKVSHQARKVEEPTQKISEESRNIFQEMRDEMMKLKEELNQVQLNLKELGKEMEEEEEIKRKKEKVRRMKKKRRRMRIRAEGKRPTGGHGSFWRPVGGNYGGVTGGNPKKEMVNGRSRNKLKKEITRKSKKRVGFRRKNKMIKIERRREDKKHEKRERSQTHRIKFWTIFKMCRRRKCLTGVHGGRRRKKRGGSSGGYCSWRYAGSAAASGGFKGGAIHCGCSGGGSSAGVSGGGTTSFNYNLIQHGGGRVRGDDGLIFYGYGGGFRGGGDRGGDHGGDTNHFAGTVFVFGGNFKGGVCHGGERVAGVGGFNGGGHSCWCLNRDAGQYYGEWSALVGSCGVGWSSFLNPLDKFQKLLEQKKEEEGHKGIIVIILVGDVMNAGSHCFFFTGITCYCERRYNGISFLKYSSILSNPISKVSGPSPSFNIQPGQYLSFLEFSTPCFWPNHLYYPPNFSTHHPLFYTQSVLNLLKLHSPFILITSNCNQEIFKFCYISINFTLRFLLNQDDLPSSKQQKMIFVTDFPTSLHSLKLSTRVANLPFLCPELHMITGILVHYAFGSRQLIQGIDLSLKTLKGNWGTTLQRIKEVGIHDSHCLVVCWNSLVLVGLHLLAIPSSAIAAHKDVKMLEIAHTLVVLVGSFTKVMESFVHGLVRIVSGTHKSLLRAFHRRESSTIQSCLPNQDIHALSLNWSGKLYANQGTLGYEEEMCIGLFKPLLLIVEADHYPP